MGTVFFLFMNAIPAASSFILAYKIFAVREFVDGLIAWFIFYFGQIVLTELLLGIFGALYLPNAVFLNAAVFLIFLLISRKKKSSFDPRGIIGGFSVFLRNKPVMLATSLIFGFGLVKILINLFNPPFGWDDLNYHFTFPVEWLKHGNLNNPVTLFDDPGPTYYPINGSLYFLWLIFPFKSVFMADLGQVPFFILGFLAVYSLGRKLNLTALNSYIAAALFTLIPNYFKQFEIAYVDVMVSSLFLTCLNFLFWAAGEFNWKNMLLYGVTLGLLLGTKTVALPYGILLLLPAFYLAFKNLKKSYILLIALSAVVLLGSFTYIRNFLDTGNPLYPLDFKLFGRVIFKGVVDIETYRAHFKIADYRLSKLLFHEGLGAQTILLIFPAVFFGLPLAIFKKRKELNFTILYFLTLPLLIYLVYRYVIPLANTRYLYCLFGVGMIVAFCAIDMLKIPRAAIAGMAVVGCLGSIFEISKRLELVFAIAAAFIFFFFLLHLLNNKKVMPFILVFLFGLLVFSEKYYLANEYTGYVKMLDYSGFWPDAAKAWEWLNENTKGDNIAYAGRPVPFPLYGTNFKNNVFYVSVNKIDPVKLQYFPGSRYRWGYDFLSLHKDFEAPGNCRSGSDYSVWMSNLIKRKVGYLFVYSLHQTATVIFPVEDEWAKSHSEGFRPVFTNATVHIYRIMR